LQYRFAFALRVGVREWVRNLDLST
jgi:hypothetical protein